MRKIFLIITIISILIYLWMSNSYNDKIKYDSWKDTIESFGDGTYQVMHQVIDEKPIEQLTNIKHKQCVITDITRYKVINSTGYFMGKYHNLKVYAVLDIKNNLLKYCVDKSDNEDLMMVYLNKMLEDKQIELVESYSNFTELEQSIFEQLR